MRNLNLDRLFTEFVLDKVPGFKHVHPTALTLLGLGVDFVILYAVWAKLLVLVAGAMFLRYACDCLDGAVARKYNKVSDLGGVLDTVADNTLIFILSLSIAKLLDAPYYWAIATVVTGANVAYLWKEGALVHHASIKRGGTFVKDVYRFGVQNNILVYVAAFAVLWGLM
jgi:phosphatidylglycerophosphate synthase